MDEYSNPPLVISPLHPDAVYSYALPCFVRAHCPEGAIAWIEKAEGKTLRWWQRLGLVLKLQHNAAGQLLKRDVTETGPRRAGKSVGIRGLALWRLEFGTALFGERQELIHTGNELAVCRKSQKEAWWWAERQWGPRSVTRGSGKEAIERPSDGSVWLVRSQSGVYGWDTTLGLCDEAWDVMPDTISEGLDPSLMGRQSPQMVKTSTSHRRATSTMKSALSDGLTTENPKILILWWGAHPDADPSDPETWRSASPYWDEERHEFISAMYDKALRGESDPELDDPDPMRGFECQFLNIWDLSPRRTRVKGEPVTSSQVWEALTVPAPEGDPDVVAVEGWPGESLSVAVAWQVEGRAVVVTLPAPDTATAARMAADWKCRRPVLVGKSLLEDPSWRGVRTTPRTGSSRDAVSDLRSLIREDGIRHDGSPHLSGQVLAARTLPGTDGPRIVSTERSDAIKAATWVATEARKPRPTIRRLVTSRR